MSSQCLSFYKVASNRQGLSVSLIETAFSQFRNDSELELRVAEDLLDRYDIRLTASGGSNGDGNYGSVLDSFRQTENDLSSLLSQQIEAQKCLRAQNELGIKADAENQLRRAELDLLKQQAALDVEYLSNQNIDETEYFQGQTEDYLLYANAMLEAQSKYEAEKCRLSGLLQDSVNTGYNTVVDGTGSLDVQVCFIAGTPILMGDESVKKIEKIVKGDRVKAAKHNDPTGKIGVYEVVETYERTVSETLKLSFNSLTIQCTKEHPFFVYGKGWVQAEMLQIGDSCRTASDKPMVLQKLEIVPGEVKVYNFQVREAHTYFVGASKNESVLVHNTCPDCDGSGMITTCVPITRRYFIVRSYVEQYVSSKACPRCQFEIGERKYRIRSTPDVKPVTIRADNTMEITIDRPEKEGRIYILYGHGLLTPHNINFKKDKYLAATFVMCHAGISNKDIPKEHQLPQFCTTHGTLMQGGNINDPDTTSYWKDIAFKGGIQMAEQWLIENPQLTHVVIYTKNLEKYRKIQLEDMAFEAEASQIIKRQ